MIKSLILTSSLITTLGLFIGGCAATRDDGDDAPISVAAESSIEERAKGAGSVVTLLNNLGSAQGATAAATNSTTAVRWPSSALKGTYNVTTGQPCSTVAASAGTVLDKTISIVGSFANCS